MSQIRAGLRLLPTVVAALAVLAVGTACEQSEAATRKLATPGDVARVIGALEASNDSTQRMLDSARVQLDTALLTMVEISAMLDNLAGRTVQPGKAEGADAPALTREGAASLRRRSVAQLEGLRVRLAGLDSALVRVRDTSRAFRGEVSRLTKLARSLARARENQEGRLSSLSEALTRVRGERDRAVARTIVLEQRADTLEHALDSTARATLARDDSVFVLIGPPDSLRALGVAEWAGGVMGVGRVLRVRSDFSKHPFDVWSKHRDVAVAMPHRSRGYRVISGQPASCYAWLESDALFVLQVLDPECFWERNRYLVIEEKR
ncbi:MAG TPA: hypothetical protein VE967_01085 [Gemmatimonadaceae bacterium]|nr:hypothetical protein [Gemmatimonadaceae bacterium]